MAAPGVDQTIFYQSLERFKLSLTDHEKEDFKLTSLNEIHDVIHEIQNEHASERKMQNMKRIQGFLEGIEQYGNVVEVFLNTSIFVAFIWGPVKFLLQVAKTWTDSLDLLLNAYEQIAGAIPLLLQYDKMFLDNQAMQRVLGLMYKDILEFHRRALVVFKRRSWRQLFRATWKDFNTHFGRLLESLRSHKRDVESQASLIQIEHNELSREAQRKHYRDEDIAETKRRTFTLMERIFPANFGVDQENLVQIWAKQPDFGKWLISHPKVEAWLDSKNTDACILWLRGIPGAGKSVLASRLIATMKKITRDSVVFFYCKHEDSRRNSLISILKGILTQLISLNPAVLSYVYDECSQSKEVVLESLELLKQLVDYAFERPQPIWMILDGLDECEKKEKKKILNWISGIVKPDEQPGHIHVLIVSQDEGDIRKHLAKGATISLHDTPQHGEAIQAYATRKAIKVRMNFDLQPPAEKEIISIVTSRSKGMFLFARLVLRHLKNQTSVAQLLEELEPSKFPTQLYEVYDRIIDRIYSNPVLPHRYAAAKILAWIVCAKRPLKWHEIQAIFSIDVDKEVVDFHGRRLRGIDVKDVCGSLVEVSTSNTVDIVHYTARSYLLEDNRPHMTPRVSIQDTHMEICFTCLRYLSFHCFENTLTNEELTSYVQRGYYSLQEFAIAYWLDYLQFCVNILPNNAVESLDQLSLAVGDFMNRHLEGQSKVPKVEGVLSDPASEIGSVTPHRIIRQLSRLQAAKKNPISNFKGPIQRRTALLEDGLERRRTIFESLVLELPPNSPQRDELTIFYGDQKGWFKCPRIRCFAFSEGFSTYKARDTHRKKHDRSFRCSFSACLYSKFGFTNFAELKRHISQSHPISHAELEGELEFPHPDGAEEQVPDGQKDPTNPERGKSSTIQANLASSILARWEQLKGKSPKVASTTFPASGAASNMSAEDLIVALRQRNLKETCEGDLTAYPRREHIKDEWLAVFRSQSHKIDVDLLHTFQHAHAVCCVKFSMDGKYLATGCNGSSQIFHTRGGEILCVFLPDSASPADNYCRSVSFSADGKFLATTWDDALIRVWDIESRTIKATLQGHKGQVNGLDFSQDKHTLGSCATDGTVRLWDIRSGDCIVTWEVESEPTTVAISMETQYIAAGFRNGTSCLWSIASGSVLAILRGHKQRLYSVAFIPGSERLITGSLDKTIKVWDLPVFPLWPLRPERLRHQESLSGHIEAVVSVTTTCDSKWIISGARDQCVQFWDSKSGESHCVLRGHDNDVVSVASSPAGALFATASWDKTMRLWSYNNKHA